MTFNGCEAAPLRLMIRPSVNPVVPAATGVFTHSLFTRPVVTGEVLDAYAGDRRRAGVIALPAAAQADVAQTALRDIDDDPAAAVRYVVPQDSADVVVVRWLDDREAGHVLHHDCARRQRAALGTCGARLRSVMIVLFAAPAQPEIQSSPKARPLIVW